MIVIKNKFSIDDNPNSSKSKILYEHLIQCHVNSRKSKSIIENLYSINSLNKKDHEIDNKILEKIQNLSNKEFFNIFDIRKDKVFFNGVLSSESLFEANKKNETVYELSNYLSKIGEIDTFYGEDYYETYAICIDPKELFYVDLANLNNEDNFNNIVNTRKDIDLFEAEIFFNDFAVDYRFYKYFKINDQKSIENLNINIKVEII